MTGQTDNVSRFVQSARRLIIIQLIMTVVALIAAAGATFLIYQAMAEQKKLDAKEIVVEGKTKVAREAEARSVAFNSLASQMRSILQAQTPEQFRAAADRLREQVKQQPDEDVYTLIATAYYRSAPQSGPERAQVIGEAAGALVEAVRQNQKRVDSFKPTGAAGEEPPKHSDALYLELAAMQCAFVKNSQLDPTMTQQSALETVLKPQALPEAIKAAFVVERKLETHPLVMRECGTDLTPVAAAALGLPKVTPDSAPVTEAVIDELYRISRVYLHVRTQEGNPTASAVEQGLKNAGLVVPRIDLVPFSPASYRPSVRYYYPEQAEQAGVIARQVADLAKANGAIWGVDAIPLVKVDLDDLPRDRVEVWLPDAGAVSRAPMVVLGQPIDKLNILYFQRPADGLAIRDVLDGLVKKGGWSVAATQIAGDFNNGLGCHPTMPPEMFAQFKQLALALFDAGMPVMQIKSYNANTPKPTSRVEILNFPAARVPLARGAIEGLATCPAPNQPLLGAQ